MTKKYKHILMNISKYKLYIPLIILVAFVSCEKDVNIALPYAGDKIVVNAILTNDSLVYAHVTKSLPTEKYQSSFEELEGAKADLYENDIFKETLVEKVIKNKRYYVSSSKIKNSANYTIKISYSGLGSVEGGDLIPAKPQFFPVEFWRASTNYDDETPYKLTLKLKDIGGVKNYYKMRIFSATYNATTKRYTIQRNSELIFRIDNFAKQGGIFGSFDDNLDRISYFTDETFDGDEITLNISIRGSGPRSYVAPEIAQLSRSAYLYFDSKNRQANNGDNPFSEAVIVYNNIKNGYGIVGGVADSVAVIKSNN